MDSPQINALKARYGFDGWRRAGAGRESLFIRHLRFAGDELAGVAGRAIDDDRA